MERHSEIHHTKYVVAKIDGGFVAHHGRRGVGELHNVRGRLHGQEPGLHRRGVLVRR